ncbi:MAG: response regulator [Candidatus Tectimicrobiota bacterium]
MDTVNEHMTDPLNQVAELLTLFLDLFAADSIGGEDTTDAVAQGLAQYRAQVNSIATAAEVRGDLGLHRVCGHYQALLATVTDVPVLSEDVRLALEEWPTLVMTYLEDPDNSDICTALIEHLQQPVWTLALTNAEAEILRQLLMPASAATAAAHEAPAAVQDDVMPPAAVQEDTRGVETPLVLNLDQNTGAESVEMETPCLELARDSAEAGEPIMAPLTSLEEREERDEVTPVLAETGMETLETLEQVERDASDTPMLTPAENLLDQVTPSLALEAAALADTSETSLLAPETSAQADNPGQTAWPLLPLDVTAHDETPLSIDAMEHEPWPEEAPEHEADVILASTYDSEAVSTLAPEAWEEPLTSDLEIAECDAATASLLALLCQEVTQLAETLAEALSASSSASAQWRQLLTDHSEELARFGDGAASMGLSGVQQASVFLCANLLHISTQAGALADSQCQLLRAWPRYMLGYLQRRSDQAMHLALVQYLADPRWPTPLAEEERETLLVALQQTNLLLEDDEPLPERQREAQLDDISLTLPSDVNPTLLETLLQELPQQAAEFSAAVQRLSSGTGTLTDVTVAQRIAHSLKGAANTVGVPGIANLTHHLEDILLAFAQQETLPTRALSRTLTSAADCLEALSEALSGLSAAPPVAMTLATLQEVLDWANLIDMQGVPSDETTVPPARDTLPEPVQQVAETTADTAVPAPSATSTPGRHLDADMGDGLLRLAGEAMILNGQLQDRLRRTMAQSRTVRAQHTLVQQLVWELEQLVDIRGVAAPLVPHTQEGEFDPLELEQYNEMHTVTRRLLEAVTDALTVGRDVEASLTALDGLLHEERRIQRESEEAIMRTRMVPAHTIAPRLQRSVRQACRATGKEAELTLHGGDTLVDSTVLSHLLDPLMHMLRNAVDHGIEPAATRLAQGKTRAGNITLAFAREGNTLVVRCQDDGAGLDYAAIRRTALARGLIEAHAVLSEEALGRLIFHAGFSTRTQTTQLSGRGIGMDVVYSRLQELKGSLRLASEARQGCLIDIRLPVSLMSTHGLLVRSGSQVFAISDLGLEQILYPAAGALDQEADRMVYTWEGERLEVSPLETLLHLHLPAAAPLATRPALLVRDETGQRHVVLVQAVLDSLPLVIKPLGRYVPARPGLAGATILGDGRAAAVLDLPGLLRASSRQQLLPDERQDTAGNPESALPVALVVDDSLSTRRALADFVQDLGFTVHTAGDGLEAIASMKRQMPDILLVDLEMPRMNGLELAEHVRVHYGAEALPIIMLTSRSTEKHRRSAERAGVNVYLVKPFVEDTMAEHIQQLMALHSTAMAGS